MSEAEQAPARPLSRERLEGLLAGFAHVRVAVVGDFYLDRYLVTDPALAEPSLETGLVARQVVAARSSPGHAGTVTNNLRALGVPTVYAVGITGDDGEGFELRRCLQQSGVDTSLLIASSEVVTGAYLKPVALLPDGGERELERLDIKNHRPVPPEVEASVIKALQSLATGTVEVDAVIAADQVEMRNHGAISDAVREELCALAAAGRPAIWYADSRRRIGEYQHLRLKPNRDECRRAVQGWLGPHAPADPLECARHLARSAGTTVFLTMSEDGITVVEPNGSASHIPAFAVSGPIDPTGAGDATTAGIVPALALGASTIEAATLGALVASITVQQLATTGTATPAQVLAAFSAR